MRLKAFTLIEIMIVVVVVGILSTALIAGISSYLKNSNDAKRSSQISVISEALERYFDANGEYPTCAAMTQTPLTIATNTLIGVKTDAFQAPGGSTNSIVCNTITNSNQFGYLLANSTTCVSSVSCLSYSLQYKEESTGLTKTINSRRNISVLDAPAILSPYSYYDMLFCRYASDCSGIAGISADLSYQIAFTAKAGSRYTVTMNQIDNTSTSWTTGTDISGNVSYTTPTSGATIAGTTLTTTNAGETRVTFSGAGMINKTTFVKITEIDSTNKSISESGYTKAFGVYTTVGTYNLNAPAAGQFEFSIVAGGGAGGSGTTQNASGGGGGAGGLLTNVGISKLTVTPQSYSIVVGSGGSGAVSGTGTGNNGANSSALGLTAIGGGGGGQFLAAGISGGSGGGGGGRIYQPGGAGISGQGNSGGYSLNSTTAGQQAGGGGGGAGGVGANGVTAYYGANGGVGSLNNIAGTSVYYGGGGGGGGGVLIGGAGGLGGGGNGHGDTGNGYNTAPGFPGSTNTGGGGGGGYTYAAGYQGGAGGSGIVYFRLYIPDSIDPQLASPTINSVAANDFGKLTVTFTPGSSGTSTITNYEYSINGGTNWTALSPTKTTSPVDITGLGNNTSYNVRLRAVSAVGKGSQSNQIAASTIPYAAPVCTWGGYANPVSTFTITNVLSTSQGSYTFAPTTGTVSFNQSTGVFTVNTSNEFEVTVTPRSLSLTNAPSKIVGRKNITYYTYTYTTGGGCASAVPCGMDGCDCTLAQWCCSYYDPVYTGTATAENSPPANYQKIGSVWVRL